MYTRGAVFVVVICFLFKQKTAYEMRISDWSSDVCSSDLSPRRPFARSGLVVGLLQGGDVELGHRAQRRADGDDTIGLTAHQLGQHRRNHLPGHPEPVGEIGRASCRARECQNVSVSVVAVTLKKKKIKKQHDPKSTE